MNDLEPLKCKVGHTVMDRSCIWCGYLLEEALKDLTGSK